MTVSGQLACASGAPCVASSCSSDSSTVAPGTFTEPGTGSYVKRLAPRAVTLTFPFAPLAQLTEHWNVDPASASISDGHFALDTSVASVESCCLIWLSIVELSAAG